MYCGAPHLAAIFLAGMQTWTSLLCWSIVIVLYQLVAKACVLTASSNDAAKVNLFMMGFLLSDMVH